MLWAVGEDALSLDRQGRLRRVQLPERATDAVAAADGLWWTGDAGLWRVPPGETRAVLVANLPDATRVAPGIRSIWVLSRGLLFRVIGGVSRPFLRVGTALDLAPAGDTVWVGTEQGLERLWLSGEDPGRVEDVLGEGDQGVAVPAVAAAPDGGCWFAAVDGTVGRVSPAGAAAAVALPGSEPARPLRIVADGREHAWVLTEEGTWRVRLDPPGQ
jgi:ligand-binding sensor domain-containing protein